MSKKIDDIGKAIHQKIGGIKCPHCKTQKDYISTVYGLPNNEEGEYNNLDKAIATPYVVFTCGTCGHTDFFNPNRLGLL